MNPDSSPSGIRRMLQALLSSGVLVVTLCLIVFVWFRTLPIEPFDTFESIHRAAATLVKDSNRSAPTPELAPDLSQGDVNAYHQILAFVSSFVDGASAGVSAFSGRALSLFFAVLSVMTLHSFWQRYRKRCGVIRFEDRRSFDLSVSPVFFLLLVAAVPAVAAVLSSDMAYQLCAVIVLCSHCRHLLSESKDRFFFIRENLFSGLGLTGAYLLEGWYGFICLSLSSLLLITLIQIQKLRRDERISENSDDARVQKSLVSQVLLSCVVCISLSYTSPYTAAQSSFASLTHSAALSPAAPTFVENLVIPFFSLISLLFFFSYLGSWILSCYCIDASVSNGNSLSALEKINPSTHSSFSRLRALWLFLLLALWSVFFIVVRDSFFLLFSITPVIAIWAASFSEADPVSWVFRNRHWLIPLARALAFFMPAVLLLIASLFLTNFSAPFRFFTDSPMLLGYVDVFFERRWVFGFSFAGAGVLSLLSSFSLAQWISVGIRRGRRSGIMSATTVRGMALLNALSSVVLLVFVVVESEELVTVPLQQSVEKAKLYLEPRESLGVVGINAPNVHTTFGGAVGMSRSASEELFLSGVYNVILTPVWNIGLCEKHGYDIAAGAAFYRLCLRSYRRALEGPRN